MWPYGNDRLGCLFVVVDGIVGGGCRFLLGFGNCHSEPRVGTSGASTGDSLPDMRHYPVGAGRRDFLDSILYCYQPVVAGSHDGVCGTEGYYSHCLRHNTCIGRGEQIYFEKEKWLKQNHITFVRSVATGRRRGWGDALNVASGIP